jgi:predicted nucleic acid-binding protein
VQKKLLLLDNTYFSDYENEMTARRIGPARRFARRLAACETVVSVITIAEYYERYGRAAAARLAANYTTLGLHVADALKCGDIQTRLAARRMGENDAWLAAQALRAGAAIVTRDKRFKDIHGLTIEDYA